MKKARMRPAAALAVVVMTAATMTASLSGCDPTPIVPDAKTWGLMSLEEQREWASLEAERAMTVLGRREGWRELLRSDLVWPENREEILRISRTSNCVPSKGSHQPGRLILDLITSELSEPFDAAERLWQHWESQGWEVRYVAPPDSAQKRSENFRADREDGAMLGLVAGENTVWLSISTSCSNHWTVLRRSI